jgi:hypothetical protein
MINSEILYNQPIINWGEDQQKHIEQQYKILFQCVTNNAADFDTQLNKIIQELHQYHYGTLFFNNF